MNIKRKISQKWIYKGEEWSRKNAKVILWLPKPEVLGWSYKVIFLEGYDFIGLSNYWYIITVTLSIYFTNE